MMHKYRVKEKRRVRLYLYHNLLEVLSFLKEEATDEAPITVFGSLELKSENEVYIIQSESTAFRTLRSLNVKTKGKFFFYGSKFFSKKAFVRKLFKDNYIVFLAPVNELSAILERFDLLDFHVMHANFPYFI